MALNILQALELCIDRILNGTTHKHYKRTVDLAKLYKQLITGENQEELLEQYFAKCSDEERAKIKTLTTAITGTVCFSLNRAFRKAVRTKPILRQIDFNGKDTENKVKTVEDKLAMYSGNESLEEWIAETFHNLTFSDPNAFVITEFKLDDKGGRQPYPFIVPSCEAVNFGTDNNVLQWLIVEQPISYKTKDGRNEKGVKLFIYFPQYAITFTQVEKGGAITSGIPTLEKNVGRYNCDKGSFEIEVFEHAVSHVPAYRIGYVVDTETERETFVSPIHYGAVPYLKKTISSDAELDLSIWAHAFPQKIVYVETCKVDPMGKCNLSGELKAGCKKCGGTGRPLHQKATDVVELEMPKSKEDMFDLEKLIAYKFPPIEGIKFLKEYVDDLKQACYKAVFNAETFSKDQTAQLATGINLDLQNVYDTLSEYAGKISKVWVSTVQFVAEIEGITERSNHRLVYPTDFKLKSVTDLLNDLKTANESGAPSYVRSELTRDIANIMYTDRPNEMLKYEVKGRLFPFQGKNPNEVLMIINGDLCRKVDAVLYAYFDQICEELDVLSLQDNAGIQTLLLGDDAAIAAYKAAKQNGRIWFYDLPAMVQKALVYAKARAIMDEIKADQPPTPDFGAGAIPPVDPNNP